MAARLAQSLALKLALQYALIFAVGAAAIFAALYHVLVDSLETRERTGVERRAEIYAGAYDLGGVAALKRQIESERSPEERPYFVRLINRDNSAVWISAPRDWVETQIERIPLGPFTWNRPTQTVRVPQNALRDFAFATRPLADGRMLQVGRLTDSREEFLRPIHRAFLLVGVASLLVSGGVGILLAWRATRPLRAVSATARRIIELGDLAAREASK